MELKDLVMEFFVAKAKQGMFGGQVYVYEIGREVQYPDEEVRKVVEELLAEGYIEVYTGGSIGHGTPYVVTEKGKEKWGKK